MAMHSHQVCFAWTHLQGVEDRTWQSPRTVLPDAVATMLITSFMGGVQDQESLQKASPKSTINFTDTNNNKSQKKPKRQAKFSADAGFYGVRTLQPAGT
mmetsp:Transcript_23704/g.37042  ORF Transcript_23704/g.37042 Transcript_23704/m.37042 type:complete len:99 (-) Transcript_23704:493-789(-)